MYFVANLDKTKFGYFFNIADLPANFIKTNLEKSALTKFI